jgi:hypothetical protein
MNKNFAPELCAINTKVIPTPGGKSIWNTTSGPSAYPGIIMPQVL